MLRLLAFLGLLLAAGPACAQALYGVPAAPNPNILLNGNHYWDQRNEGATYTGTGTYGDDAWKLAYTLTSATLTSVQRVSTTPPQNYPYSTTITVGTGASLAAGDTFLYLQKISGERFTNLGFGTSTAVPLAVTVWLKSSIASAKIAVSLANVAQNRSFVHDCQLSSTASTWTLCTFAIPGDTTGTWATTYNTASERLNISAGCGSTSQGTADAWSASQIYCTANSTNVFATSSATLGIGPVKLEAGATPTAIVLPTDPAAELLTLQKYYWKTFPIGTKPAQSAGVAGTICFQAAVATTGAGGVAVLLPTQMVNATYTITTYNPSAANAKWRDVTGAADITQSVDPASAKGTTGFNVTTATDATTAAHTQCIHATADSGF